MRCLFLIFCSLSIAIAGFVCYINHWLDLSSSYMISAVGLIAIGIIICRGWNIYVKQYVNSISDLNVSFNSIDDLGCGAKKALAFKSSLCTFISFCSAIISLYPLASISPIATSWYFYVTDVEVEMQNDSGMFLLYILSVIIFLTHVFVIFRQIDYTRNNFETTTLKIALEIGERKMKQLEFVIQESSVESDSNRL